MELDVLKDLHLDPRNVRLEDADAQVEADIIEDLFVNEDALGLVDGICKVGYLTHETPVVVKRGGRYVMVEGNRRLAALKAIQNPQLVPEYRARVATLADRLDDRSGLSSIRVMIAPNQGEADQLVAAIHTGNLRRRWTPTRQAAFFQAQIDSGRKLKTLIGRYPTIDVRKFVFRAHILNEFKAVKFSDPGLTDYLQTKAWNRGLSALARIYESRDFLELTGFSMDDKGLISKSVSKKTFKQMATLIVQGMRDGELNTRSLNTIKSPRFIQLMNELRAIAGEPKPDEPKADRSSDNSTASDGAKSGGKGAASATAGSNAKGKTNGATATSGGSKKKQHFLDLGQMAIPDSYPIALRLHLTELSVLDVQRFPNATFLLMRAVLEKSIKAFAEAKGKDIKGSGNNEKGWVQLSHALNWLLQYVKEEGPRNMIQPINRVRGGTLVTYTATSDSMNAANHNHHFFVDPSEALGMWDSIDPIMRYVMKP